MDQDGGLEKLASRESAVELLRQVGFPSHSAVSTADLFVLCRNRLLESGTGGRDEACAFWVPGRIEILGKHTDYAGGRSLLIAAERGFCFVAVPRLDSTLQIFDVIAGGQISFPIGPEIVPEAHWPNFPMTVARRLSRNFGNGLRGADVAFASNLPRAAGMSSSSAMLIGFSLILIHLNRLQEQAEFETSISSLEDLAGYLATVENGQSFGSLSGDQGVGTFGGSEDHTAILCCSPGKLSQYSFCPVRFERHVRVPDGLVFAVGVSGVAADKTGDAREKFNRASRLALEAARVWRAESGFNDQHLAAAVARCHGRGEKVREVLINATCPEFSTVDLVARFEQFYCESERVLPEAGDALGSGDLQAFGELVEHSQDMAEEHLGNQVAETSFLVRTARKLGAHAASAFGAGFGGSVWALVNREDADAWLKDWAQIYAQNHPEAARTSDFLITDAGPAAQELLGRNRGCAGFRS